ncbi:hypothetical protein FQA39_LY11659 [Lamprigera yunnana]|nr:hypothetical protein FQA39_LY11659 [Lamprigera yunnana]
MKVYIFVLIAISLQCIAAFYLDNFNAMPESYEKYVEETCVKQSKVLPQLIENLKSKGIFEDNKKLKEFVVCYESLMRFIDEHGNIFKDTSDVKTKRGFSFWLEHKFGNEFWISFIEFGLLDTFNLDIIWIKSTSSSWRTCDSNRKLNWTLDIWVHNWISLYKEVM